MNENDSNPYASNSPYASTSQQSPQSMPFYETDAYVKQLPVVGTLVIVQGVLEGLMAVMGIVMVVAMGLLSGQAQFQKEMQNVGPGASPVFLIIVYGAIAVVMSVIAIVRIASGVMILRRKNRMFAIVSTILCIGSVFTCYCGPTSIAICVYALIILLHPTVERAFAMRAAEVGV